MNNTRLSSIVYRVAPAREIKSIDLHNSQALINLYLYAKRE